MKSFFNSDSMLFRILTILMEFALMNLMFILCCIPVVTAGSSYTALTESLHLFVQKGEGCFSAGNFLKTFKNNLKSTIPVWCGGLLSMIVLLYEAGYWFHSFRGTARIILSGICLLLFLLVFGILQFWLFLTGRGQKAGIAFLKDCFLLSLARFPSVLLMAAFTASPLLLLLLSGSVLIRMAPVLLLFCFSFPAFFCVRLHEKILPPLFPALFPEDD